MIEIETENKTNCLPHFIVILIAPLLFFIALLMGYVGLIPINVEMHTLLIIFIIFVIFAFFIKHNANYSVCQMRGSFDEMEASLKDELRDNALTIMGETKSTLVIHEFLAEYYKEIRDDNFAKVASSVFPMLGILGTFIAIAMSMPDFTVKDVDALDKEITLLLSGIGTAFYASIYGIFLSLLWTYFEKRGSAKVDRTLHDLERLYNRHIWKRSELLKHEHQQSEFKDQQIVQTLKDTFNLDFIRELNEQYLRNYKTIIDDTTNSFGVLTQKMQVASHDLRETITLIHGRQESINAVSQIKTNIEGFNENAIKVHQVIKEFDNSVDHTFVKIDQEVGNVVERLSEFALVISEQNKQIQESLRLQKLENDEKS